MWWSGGGAVALNQQTKPSKLNNLNALTLSPRSSMVWRRSGGTKSTDLAN